MKGCSLPSIGLVVPDLRGGGAESVVRGLAEELAHRGAQVTLISLRHETPFKPPLPSVRFVSIGLGSRGFWSNLLRAPLVLFRLHRILAACDVAISFLTPCNVFTLLAAGKPPVIVSERSHPGYEPCAQPWRLLRAVLYPRARSVVLLSEKFLAALPQNWKKRVIPNWVAASEVTVPLRDRPRRIIALGRLDAVKCFSDLIMTFAELAPSYPDWELQIWGDGPERAALTALAAQTEAKITLPGRTDVPQRVLAEAQIFALCSRYEGFPNALGEAMASGLACIASECPSAIPDMITPGQSGLLYPPGDRTQLRARLQELLDNPERREQLGRAARELPKKFDKGRIVDQWIALIEEVVAP